MELENELYLFPAKVVRIIDGDTVEVEFFLLPESVYPQIKMKHKLRFLGVNTAEMKAKDPNEKALALKAKTYVTSRLLSQEIIMQVSDSDVFGRLLVTVFINGENLNAVLLENGLARVYERR